MKRTRSKLVGRKRWLGIEPLEPRVLLSAVPRGNVDIFNRTQIVGWAYDADDGAAAINVNVTVNGVTTTVPADQFRASLTGALGSAYHSFSFTMPTLGPGSTPVIVQAVSAATGASKILLNSTLKNPAPSGWVDLHSNTQIAGWAFDPDSTSPIQVRIDIDGAAGTPFTTNVTRPDVAALSHDATSGFSMTGDFAGKVVEVYMIDAPSEQAVLLWTNNKPPVGSVDINNGYSVAGWAVDPDEPSASIQVQVDLDGAPVSGSPTTASLTRNDLVSKFGSANHGFSIAIPGMRPGYHKITVYAIDGEANSAAPVLIGSRTIYDAPPVGHVDVVNSSVIKGWTLDPDSGAAPINISIYVDDTLFTTVTANLDRHDLVPTYHSAWHGFSVSLASLAPGSHAITVTAADNRVSDQTNVVIYDGFINNHQPIGHVDSTSNNTIAGWAQDPDTPTGAIAVDVYVDGTYQTTTTANISRADLTHAIGSPNHGFAVTLPSMTFGSHKVEVYAAESQGNVSTLIGSATVVNNRPTGWLDVASATTLVGWVYDKDTPTQSLNMVVYINGVQATTATANVTRSSLTASLGSANHGFSITLPTLSSGSNQIDIYAVDINNGLSSIIKSTVIVV